MEDTVTVYVLARIVDLVSGDRDRDGGTDYDLDGWRSIGGVDPRSGRIEPLVADWRISGCLVHDACIYPSVCGKIHQFPSVKRRIMRGLSEKWLE